MFMFLSLSMFFFCRKNSFLYYSIILITSTFLYNTLSLTSFFSFSSLYFDSLAITLIFLTIIVSCLSFMASSYFSNKLNLLNFMFMLMNLVLILAFLSKSPIVFYFWFEASLIPIFLIILGWGYQPERIFAGKSMFLYTIIGSLPFLFIILYQAKFLNINLFNLLMFFPLEMTNSLSSNIKIMMIITSFLIKFPLYSTHLWLPKAHVEAPVSGSMILAGVLLKLGGFGIYRMSIMFSAHNFMNYFIIFLSLLGGSWISMICVVQTDMKVLIAYSSVSHMSLAISSFLIKTLNGSIGAKLMLICHGWSSSALFFGINVFYLQSKSRNINFSKGLLKFLPLLTLLWAITCASNMACPTSLNLFSELLIFISLMSFFSNSSIPLGIMAFLAAAYSLILFASLTHGKFNFKSKNILSSATFEILILLIFSFINFLFFALMIPYI